MLDKLVSLDRASARIVILAATIAIIAAGAAHAAGLTQRDYRYLQDGYGLTADSEMIKDLAVEEQAKLHDLINDPSLKDYPHTIDHNVADFLFTVHMRECNVWSSSHGEPECPPATDASAEPGKEIADRQCNACHLFGTMDAPSFLQLAREGKLSEQSLADALDHGHKMSPITMQPTQVRDLMIYIRSLK